MVVTITTSDILLLVRSISHREVAGILDVEARYRAEAGSEKAAELEECVKEGIARLQSRVYRFLTSVTYSPESGFPTTVAFNFDLSDRRGNNKEEAITEACNTFVLEYALSKFYSIVSQGELSNKHSLATLETGNHLDELLYTKNPPIVVSDASDDTTNSGD